MLVNGRDVGWWSTDRLSRVRLRFDERPDPWAERALRKEAERLTAYLGGQTPFPVYPSPAMQS